MKPLNLMMGSDNNGKNEPLDENKKESKHDDVLKFIVVGNNNDASLEPKSLIRMIKT